MKDPLRIAIVHYHLAPGGVTTVIRHATEALTAAGGVSWVVLCGGAPEGADWAHVRTLPALAYDGRAAPVDLAAGLVSAAREALGGPPDLWHFHNHAIGKSSVLVLALHELARRGERLLLQIHDFVEDGRPANFQKLLREVGHGDRARLSRHLYPAAPHIHYAALNLRDLAALRAAGLPAGCAHHLPNCAAFVLPEGAAAPAGPPLFVYPTRAIRRKNLGEFLLWAAVSEPGARWATTLAPTSPVDRGPYEAWREFAAELRLPVEFEAGIRHRWSLDDLLAAATSIVTTSVAEGFGLAFLEPWLAGRPLYGRDLPDITMDFKETGLELHHLYADLLVPVAWVGADRLRAAVTRGLETLCTAYGRSVPAGAAEVASFGMAARDRVDFGRLDETMQREVIRRVRADEASRTGLVPRHLVAPPLSGSVLAKNRAVAAEKFGLAQYGRRLLAVYAALRTSEPAPLAFLDMEKLLDGFLEPSKFRLLRG